MKRVLLVTLLVGLLIASSLPVMAAKPADTGKLDINVLLNTAATRQILTELGTYGRVAGTLEAISAVFMRIDAADLEVIRALPYVEAANPDQERQGAPIDTVALEDFSGGRSTWDLDAINVTDLGYDNRQIGYDGSGVYVAVLDTGLIDMWRQYFPEERIAEEYARCFGGGGADRGVVSEQPNKWEHDTDSHGTHVTSTILGYSFRGTPINGVAPMATVIPVKVLNQKGWGWSSVISEGITYIASLKDGPLANHPVVINMSLGGPALDAVEKAAIDYAIEQGVIIVASAGNNGENGMGYPGAYEPVISVAAAGWVDEWIASTADLPWWASDVPDPGSPVDYYIVDFSSRALCSEDGDCQDLDVAAPGTWVLGPYQTQSGQTSYYYLGGTSMAAPHVAGVVALMAQKNPGLTAEQAEEILEDTALDLGTGSRNVMTPWGFMVEYSWGDNATGAGLVQADAALAAPLP